MVRRKQTTLSEFPTGGSPLPREIVIRQRILQAAEERFRIEGYQRVSMDELAADLGMSKKTIYKHFRGKDALMTQIARQAMQQVEQRVSEIVASDASFVDKLTTLLPLIGRQYVRLSRILKKDLARHAPNIWKEIEAFRRVQATTKIYPMLKAAKAEGVLRPEVSPELFFLLFLTAIEGILNPFTLADEPYSTDEAFAGIFRILFQGALTDEASARFAAKLTSESFQASVRVE